MTIPAMLRADSADVNPLLRNRVTDAIARFRLAFFIGIGVLYVLGFNGRWRVGQDSAIYRGLALSLAHGEGYQFGEWAPKQIYPGFPYLLAAVERMLGPAHPTPSLAEQQRLLGPSPATTASVMIALVSAVLALIVTYRLIRLNYETWVATTITCGVATNAIFLQHAHELLTDVPFLLGVVTALYGWELLKRAQGGSAHVVATLLAVVGLVIAALLRPTFWILAIAWAAVCVWGLIRGPRRFHAICLVVLLGIWGTTLAMNPRGYESEAMQLLPQAASNFGGKLYDILRNQLPAAVFGEQLAPFSVLGSLLALGSTLLLLRRHTLWVLMVFGTFCVTMILSAEPRYYLMVIPVLLLGWLMMTLRLCRKVPSFWGEVILVASLCIITLNNLSASVGFFIEQRRGDFMTHYKKGEYVPLLEICEHIRRHAKPGDDVLGPTGAIMSVFSGVHVWSQREALPNGEGPHVPEQIARREFDLVVFPATVYRSKEPIIARLMDRRIILPLKLVARGSKGMYLATAKVTIPTTDWRRLPRGWRPDPDLSTTKPVKKKPATKPAVRRRPATRPAATRPAATRPATRPSTRAAVRPAPRPATRPTTAPATSFSAYDLRAMTTMLSPVFDRASGELLSGVAAYGGSLPIRFAAAATSGPGSPLRATVIFLTPK